MHNTTLHATLEAFAADAAGQLAAETASGAEIPFEVVEEPGARASLYCYRPLTGAFIRDRLGMLSALPTYAPAARALAALDGVDAYLRQRGEARIPGGARERADAALRAFLSYVFAERSEFGFDPGKFEKAYAELERALYEGRCVATVIAPLLGIALESSTRELALGDGLSLMRGDAVPDAPAEAVWGSGEEPNVLAVLTVAHDRTARSPVSTARGRFRRVLTALRLFERGGYALGPIGWARTDSGAWRTVALGSSGRPRFVTFISAEHEDELRAFCSLIARRAPTSGEVAWALARFEMGCERLAPFESLTDYLLALRALLEPEGPGSGRLAQRLAAICAKPEDRPHLAQRTAHAISLERAVIAGLAPAEPGVDALVDELAEHLRALLRDVICGHLDPDLRAVADELLAEAASAPAA
ncbi:MAG TPA: hypothetical protein VH279_00210 [Solirubrobacteraceae bacterium]|nr:hypothetical protein [Solirubrobacteraceae bacterium]